jgi:CpeS-like protein
MSKIAELSIESLTLKFFRQCEGEWKSQRRYYTLTDETEPEEVVSLLKVQFLEIGNPELIMLANSHNLGDKMMVGGSKVTWSSNYIGKSRKPSKGSTVFGILGDVLYRDRGFATPKPIQANLRFTNPETMCLKTEYNGNLFEEELKLIGENYRTRQTIISRSGEQIMIGQYLEKRIG